MIVATSGFASVMAAELMSPAAAPPKQRVMHAKKLREEIELAYRGQNREYKKQTHLNDVENNVEKYTGIIQNMQYDGPEIVEEFVNNIYLSRDEGMKIFYQVESAYIKKLTVAKQKSMHAACNKILEEEQFLQKQYMAAVEKVLSDKNKDFIPFLEKNVSQIVADKVNESLIPYEKYLKKMAADLAGEQDKEVQAKKDAEEEKLRKQVQPSPVNRRQVHPVSPLELDETTIRFEQIEQQKHQFADVFWKALGDKDHSAEGYDRAMKEMQTYHDREHQALLNDPEWQDYLSLLGTFQQYVLEKKEQKKASFRKKKNCSGTTVWSEESKEKKNAFVLKVFSPKRSNPNCFDRITTKSPDIPALFGNLFD